MFFAAAKSSFATNLELNFEDEATLNRIFCELYAELDKKRKANESSSISMTGLRQCIPSDFFNPFRPQEVAIRRPRKNNGGAAKRKCKFADPSTGDADLKKMFSDFVSHRSDESVDLDITATLIRKLEEAGFNVEGNPPETVYAIYKEFMRESIERITRRPASFNCYDYIRLKDEMMRLNNVSPEDALKCKKILALIAEVKQAEIDNPEYPVRPFPFDRVESKSPWAYQCLRMMDEILYTTPNAIPSVPTDENCLSSADTMQGRIESACRKYCIEYKNVSQDSLKKYFAYLRNLINVEFNGDFRKAYANDGVYEYHSSHGHKYAMMKNRRERVTAFKLCFSLSEARIMQREINSVIKLLLAKGYISGRDSFKAEFPLLATLADIDKYNPSALPGRKRLNSIDGKQSSSLYTLNYLPPEEPAVKEKVRKALESTPRLDINIESGHRQGTYSPISINEQGLSWSLLARDINSHKLYNIQPNEFGKNFTLCSHDNTSDIYFQHSQFEDNVIGLGDFHLDRDLCRIKLFLSGSGFEKLSQETDPLYPLIDKLDRVTDGYYCRHPKGVAYISVYVNDDFFEEVYRLDRNKHIEDIAPEDVKSGYVDFLNRRNYRASIIGR